MKLIQYNRWSDDEIATNDPPGEEGGRRRAGGTESMCPVSRLTVSTRYKRADCQEPLRFPPYCNSSDAQIAVEIEGRGSDGWRDGCSGRWSEWAAMMRHSIYNVSKKPDSSTSRRSGPKPGKPASRRQRRSRPGHTRFTSCTQQRARRARHQPQSRQRGRGRDKDGCRVKGVS